MAINKVTATPPQQVMGGRIGEITGPMPAGVPPMMRRFWSFIDRMRQKFNRELLATGKSHSDALTEVAIEEVTGQKKGQKRR